MDSATRSALVSDTLSAIDEEYYRQINEYNKLKNGFIELSEPNSNSSELVNEPSYVKALIVMLYAHYEGFVKFSSIQYVCFINKLELTTDCVMSQLAAANNERVFLDMEKGEKKCELFRNSLPDDSVLHRLFRRSVLVENLSELWGKPLNIDTAYIDTDSNLKYDILKRTLYSIGLDPELMAEYKDGINKLLMFRNPAAHGDAINDNTYINQFSGIERDTLGVILKYRDILRRAIVNESYLKNNT